MNLNRLMIRASIDNLRSRSLAERLGFTQEGVQREAYLLYGKYHDLAVYSTSIMPPWNSASI